MVACFIFYAPVTHKKVILHQREIVFGGNQNSAGLMAMHCPILRGKQCHRFFKKLQLFYTQFIHSGIRINKPIQVNLNHHIHHIHFNYLN